MTQSLNQNTTLQIQNLEKHLDSVSLLLTTLLPLLIMVTMISILKNLLDWVLLYQPHVLPSLVILLLLLLTHLHLNMTFIGLLLLLLSSFVLLLLTRTSNRPLLGLSLLFFFLSSFVHSFIHYMYTSLFSLSIA